MINILDIIWAEGRTRQICIQDQPTGRAGGWGRVCWWVWLVIGAEPIYLTQLSSIHQLGHDKLISVTRVRIPAECREIETFHLLCNSFKIINSNSASSLTIKPYSIIWLWGIKASLLATVWSSNPLQMDFHQRYHSQINVALKYETPKQTLVIYY